MSKILNHFKHFFTVSKFHDGEDFLGDIVDEKLIDFDNIFMAEFMVIFEFIDNLKKWND